MRVIDLDTTPWVGTRVDQDADDVTAVGSLLLLDAKVHSSGLSSKDVVFQIVCLTTDGHIFLREVGLSRSTRPVYEAAREHWDCRAGALRVNH